MSLCKSFCTWLILALAPGLANAAPASEEVAHLCARMALVQFNDLADRLKLASRLWHENHCYREAESQLIDISSAARKQDRQILEISALVVLADLYDYENREDAHARTLARLRALDDDFVGDEMRLQIQLVQSNQLLMKRRYGDALDLLSSALDNAERKEVSPDLRGRIHIARAHAYQRLGLKKHGESCLADVRVAIEILKNIPDGSHRLGEAYWRLGRCEETYPKAFPHFDTGLSLCQKAGNVRCQEEIHNSYAIRLRLVGRYQDALQHYLSALDIAKRYGFDATAGMLLGNIANLHRVSNRNADALTALQESIPLTRKYGTRYSISYRLETLGRVHLDMDNPEGAAAAFAEALEIRSQAGYGYEKVTVAQGLGEALLALGRKEEAVALLQQTKQEARDVLNGLTFARTVVALSRADAADEAELVMAADVARFLGAAETEWSARHMLAHHVAKQGNIDLAVFHGKQAVNLFQRVRALNVGMERQAQRDLLARGEQMYKDLTGWLIEQGRLPEAQQILSMLKEDEQRNFTRSAADGSGTHASLSTTEALWQQRFQTVSGKLMALGEEYRALQKRAKEQTLNPEEEKRLQALNDDLDVADRAFSQTLEEMKTAFKTLVAERRLDLELKQLDESLTGVVGELGEGAALLQTIVLNDGMRLILTGGQTRKAYKVDVKEKDLNQAVLTLLQALRNPKADPRPAAKALHDWLIQPIAADLAQLQVKTLMFSLDGALRYAPMAALYDGKQYLAEQYGVALYTSVGRENLKDQPKPHWKVAGMGVSLAHEGFNPLPSVPGELNGIVHSGPESSGVLPGSISLDAEFTQGTMRQALTRQPSVVHLASHFSLNPGTEADSFLLLGDGSRLSLAELRQGRYPFNQVDLVTLSACETATTGGKGSEVEGMAVIVQKKGAKSVLATLWPVADTSTAAFMQYFYRVREQQKVSKAEAIRQTQIAMLNGELGGANAVERGLRDASGKPITEAAYTTDPKAPYAHPYYWAPFVLMGNWL